MDCLPVDDLCHLQVAFEQRMQEEVIPPYILFEGVKDTYLFHVNGEWVIVFREKGE